MKKLNLKTIRIDGGTQSRVEISQEAVADYAEALKAGAELPPVVVFHDGADHWLADGFHRFHAHGMAGKASVLADIRAGTQRDAVLFSLGANCTHGLRRTNADKRKAVAAMLADSEWSGWSDRKIAEACGVSNTFVSNLRKPPEVSTVDTPAAQKSGKEVITVITPQAPARQSESLKSTGKRTLDQRPADVPELTDAHDLAEAHDTITELAQENEQLRDRLAVESMDVSEDEKTQAAETIRELRARVHALEAELSAVKASRDTHLRENAELKAQCQSYQRKLKKLEAA